MLRKIVVLIGSMLLVGVASAEDAPLPFDEPAAAPPIVRKAPPPKAIATDSVLRSKGKKSAKGKAVTKGQSSQYSRKASKAKSKAAVSSKKSAKSSNKAAKTNSAKKNSTSRQANSANKKQHR